jgi:hypothetical protein
VLNAGIGNLSHANNNRVERLNGTQRKDQSAVRMQETHTSLFAEGQRIKYSFVKRSMALENETSIKKAGVEEIKRNNTWLNLLESSIKKVNS